MHKYRVYQEQLTRSSQSTYHHSAYKFLLLPWPFQRPKGTVRALGDRTPDPLSRINSKFNINGNIIICDLKRAYLFTYFQFFSKLLLSVKHFPFDCKYKLNFEGVLYKLTQRFSFSNKGDIQLIKIYLIPVCSYRFITFTTQVLFQN